MRGGWFCLWRKFRNHPFWLQRRRFSRAEAWLDLLMDTAFEDQTVVLGNRIVEVKRGQALFSARKKAAKWLWARNCVHAFFLLLERERMVNRAVSHGVEGGHTLITILNFEKYQGFEETLDPREVSHGLSHEVSHGRATVEPRPEPLEQENKTNKKTLAPAADAAAARKAATKKPPDPNVKALIDFWAQTYFERFHEKPPVPGGKYGAIAKQLLAGRSLQDAEWLVKEHIYYPPQFYANNGLYGLEHVLAAAPTLLARRARREEY